MDGEIKKEHLSASSMNLAATCGEAWYRRYILKDKTEATPSLARGLAFHSMAKKNNTQKIESRIDLPEGDLKDYVADRIEAEFTGPITLEPGEEKNKTKGKIKDLLVATVPVYRANAEHIQPRTVETVERVIMPESKRDLLLVMDLDTETDEVIDYKTSGKKKSQNDADTDNGLTAYSMAFFLKHKRLPKKISFHNFVGRITPKKQEIKTEFNKIDTVRDHKDFEIFLKRMEMTGKMIDAGVFMPAPAGSWKCNPRFCGYWHSCPYINSERIAAAEAANKKEEEQGS